MAKGKTTYLIYQLEASNFLPKKTDVGMVKGMTTYLILHTISSEDEITRQKICVLN